jgi:hypothetical protein
MKFWPVFCMLMVAGAVVSGAPISFPQCPPTGLNTTGCELLITVTSVNGSGAATAFTVATSSPDLGPFDGVEDTLIGITNAASPALKSIVLNGGVGSGVFGFDGDGACPAGSYTPGPTAAQCGTALQNSTGYGSAGASFTAISASTDSGTVLVGGAAGLANGQSTWFDLEGAITAPQLTGVPEPGSFVLLGTALSALLGIGLRRRLRT